MAGSTFIPVPTDITDATSLRRFLMKLVEQLDIAFGNRGNSPFTQTNDTIGYIDTINNTLLQIQNSLNSLNNLQDDYSVLTGVRDYTNVVGYDTNKTFIADTDIVSKKYVDDRHPEQPAITSLSQTISATYVQAEVQAISSKVDSILVALRLANIIVD